MQNIESSTLSTSAEWIISIPDVLRIILEYCCIGGSYHVRQVCSIWNRWILDHSVSYKHCYAINLVSRLLLTIGKYSLNKKSCITCDHTNYDPILWAIRDAMQPVYDYDFWIARDLHDNYVIVTKCTKLSEHRQSVLRETLTIDIMEQGEDKLPIAVIKNNPLPKWSTESTCKRTCLSVNVDNDSDVYEFINDKSDDTEDHIRIIPRKKKKTPKTSASSHHHRKIKTIIVPIIDTVADLFNNGCNSYPYVMTEFLYVILGTVSTTHENDHSWIWNDYRHHVPSNVMLEEDALPFVLNDTRVKKPTIPDSDSNIIKNEKKNTVFDNFFEIHNDSYVLTAIRQLLSPLLDPVTGKTKYSSKVDRWTSPWGHVNVIYDTTEWNVQKGNLHDVRDYLQERYRCRQAVSLHLNVVSNGFDPQEITISQVETNLMMDLLLPFHAVHENEQAKRINIIDIDLSIAYVIAQRDRFDQVLLRRVNESIKKR